MHTAALFPGQGSHAEDLTETLARLRPDLLELAHAELGDKAFARTAESTAYAQPATYCASLAGWSLLGPKRVDVLVGHSLGELSALAAAGAVDEASGLRLVVLRGRLMERAAEEAVGEGGMLALSVSRDVGAAFARGFGLTLANDNSPDQVVLSGERDRLEVLAEEVGATGVRTKLLPIRGAFHSSAMASAREEFADALRRIHVREPRIPVFSCMSAGPMDDPRRRLTQGLTSPVRWRETLVALRRRGVESFIDVGPGKVLARLVKRTLDGVEATTAQRLSGGGLPVASAGYRPARAWTEGERDQRL
jgi:[acyl-carrier-protein] S-malonyltransferase